MSILFNNSVFSNFKSCAVFLVCYFYGSRHMLIPIHEKHGEQILRKRTFLTLAVYMSLTDTLTDSAWIGKNVKWDVKG